MVIYFSIFRTEHILKCSGQHSSLAFLYICLKYTWIRFRIHLPEGLQIFFSEVANTDDCLLTYRKVTPQGVVKDGEENSKV